ncbi:MAG: ferritin [Planctomycetota bacterium]|jgi:ferritin
MLKSEIEAALNHQINYEQGAAQEYLAMAAYFDDQNLPGFAKFMRAQCAEETEHATKLFDHICERGGRVKLGPVGEPTFEFGSAKAVFEAALAREQANTKSIHDLYKLALDHGDYPTQVMLHWFIEEQVEEEAWCEEAVAHLGMVGESVGSLLMLDKKYGKLAEAHS